MIALHRAGVAPGLADGLASRGVPVQVTRNMADTWLAVRERWLDAYEELADLKLKR